MTGRSMRRLSLSGSRWVAVGAVLAVTVILSAACGDGGDSADIKPSGTAQTEETTETEEANAAPGGDIIDVASDQGNLTTFLRALDESGLTDTLSGDGPFTVLAPSDQAFEDLAEGTLDSLFADPDGALTDILELHVVSGSAVRMAEGQLAGIGALETLGGPVSVFAVIGPDPDNEGQLIATGLAFGTGGAELVGFDVPASNGVIYEISGVITEAG